jgi:hypothetical protein
VEPRGGEDLGKGLVYLIPHTAPHMPPYIQSSMPSLPAFGLVSSLTFLYYTFVSPFTPGRQTPRLTFCAAEPSGANSAYGLGEDLFPHQHQAILLLHTYLSLLTMLQQWES